MEEIKSLLVTEVVYWYAPLSRCILTKATEGVVEYLFLASLQGNKTHSKRNPPFEFV